MDTPFIHHGVKPRIAEVSARPMTFPPGSRILVRTSHRLDREQTRRLTRSLSKWSGVEEELIFVYCAQDMEIEVDDRPTGIAVPPSAQ